ncbi:MAG: FAD/NAD(P)-binding protein [Acidimicrobiia bacterium]
MASADPMLPRTFRVTNRRQETPEVVTLTFEPADHGSALGGDPGQFTMVYVFGIGEVPLSVAGVENGRLIHTVRPAGAVTKAICALEPGELAGVRGPYGAGWPLAEATGHDVVIAAGGLGLAPLRPVMTALLENRTDFEYVSLVYGVRSPSDLLYADELHQWRSRFDAEIEVTVDRSEAGWLGDVGVVTTLLGRIPFDPANTTAMVCGPEIMMRVTARELADRGVPGSSIHLSLERNMKCAIGFCGHCQFGPDFICRDGPVRPFDLVANRMRIAEL